MGRYPEGLLEAARDLRWLLDRGYPRDASLALVGNRYGLTKAWREVLKRGVLPTEVARRRRGKVVPPGALKGERVAVDGHNVLITLKSALEGKVVLLADDGFLRDTAGVSRAFAPDPVTSRALDLVLQGLLSLGPREVLFLLDAPMSRSGELASEVRRRMERLGLRGEARAERVPERVLWAFDGVVCSADGDVIDKVEKAFDLAGYIVREEGLCDVLRLKD